MGSLASVHLEAQTESQADNLSAVKNAGSLDSTNLDLQLVYGTYNNMISNIYFSQQKDDFVYFLSSSYKRSNDYGYRDQVFENTSFSENSLEFSGNFSVDPTLTTIFEAGVDTDSRGMYNKADYSREEKDKVLLTSKNVKKFSSMFESYLTFSSAFYKHRLDKRQEVLEDVKNSLTRYTGETGGELIWSSSNRLKYSAQYTHYEYSSDIEDDQYVQSEITDDFKISSYAAFTLGLNLAWNRDNGLFAWDVQDLQLPVMPIAAMTFYGNEYYTAYLKCRYDLQPFRPEEYYYNQSYIYPTYDLPPAKVLNTEARLDLIVTNILSLKSTVNYRYSDNYYNYLPSEASENLLTAHPVNAHLLTYEFAGDVVVFPKTLSLTGGIKFLQYTAHENLTYHPGSSFDTVIRYTGPLFNIDWTNSYNGSVYIHPDADDKMDPALVGYLDVQIKTIETFYAYVRFENLYDSEYFVRDGYPEAGLSILGGLRILL